MKYYWFTKYNVNNKLNKQIFIKKCKKSKANIYCKDVLLQNDFLSTDKTSSGAFSTICGKTVALEHPAIIGHQVYM